MRWRRLLEACGRSWPRAAWPSGSAVVLGTASIQWPEALVSPDRLAAMLAAAAMLALLVGVAPGRLRADRLQAAWLVVFLLAAGTAGLRAHDALLQRPMAEAEGRDLVATGRVGTMREDTDSGVRFRFRVERCEWVDPAIALRCPAPLDVSLAWARRFDRTDASANAPPEPGEHWRLRIRLRSVAARINPAGFDAERMALEQGIDAVATVRPDAGNRRLGIGWSGGFVAGIERMRQRLHDGIGRATEDTRPEIAGVLVALTIGEQSAIPPAWWQRFNATGIGHLMSISGLHITMIAALGGALAGGLWRALARRAASRPRLASWLLRWPRPPVRWIAATVCAFGYSAIAGWGIPAQRTCLMVATAAWVALRGRDRSIGPALWLAAAIIVMADPWAVWSPGFWLSFGAVAAIVRLGSTRTVRPVPSPRATSVADGLRARLRRPLSEAAATQWASTIALLPLGVAFFSTVSIVGPIANLVAIPLVSAIVTPVALLGAAASLACEPCAALVMQVPIHATDLLLRWLEWLDGLPAASVIVARPSAATLGLALAGAFVMLAPWPWPGRAVAVFALFPLVTTPVDAPGDDRLRITAFDVGQGMAVLVETAGRRLLYDTGPRYGSRSDAGVQVILPYLRARGIRHLDTMVVSHADNEHAGGAASILERIGVGRIASSLVDGHPLTVAGPAAEPCVRGLAWQWGDAVFEWLHPGIERDRSVRAASNSRSCVLRIVSPAGSVLLAGDVQADDERRMLAALEPSRLRADVLLVPHHGSNASSGAPFLDAVAPRIAIIQAGRHNRYHHPHPKVLDRLAARGVRILRTDQDGAVTIELAVDRAPRIHRMRADEPRHWRVRPASDDPGAAWPDGDAADTAVDASAATPSATGQR